MEANTIKRKKIDLENLTYRGQDWDNEGIKLSAKIWGNSYEDSGVKFTSFKGLTLIRGYYAAYEEHCPIAITPDIIWLLLMQALSNHINYNAEKLRDKFVDFQGQKTLIVNIPKFYITQLTNKDYADSFGQFASQIEKYIGKEKKELFDFNFSTTTPTIKTVGYANLMCGMQKYFKYEIHLCGCGIPYIILEGTLEDWEKIKENFIKFKEFSAGNEDWMTWIEEVSKILDKIVEEFKAETPDKEFWKKFIRKSSMKEYGPSGMNSYDVDAIEGWLLSFYPYNYKGESRFDLEGPIKIKDIGDSFARDIVVTPLKIVEDTTGKSFDTEIRSGFLGMIKDKNHLVKPEIGWIVSDQCEDFKAKDERIRRWDY